MITNTLLLIVITMCFLAFILNLNVFNAPTLATLDAIACVITLIAIIDLRINQALTRAANIGAAGLFFLLIAFAYKNQSTEFGLIWMIFFPVFVITVMGHKKGLVLTGIFYAVLFVMAYNAIGVWDHGQWSVKAFTRLFFGVLTLTCVAYAYEAVFQHYNEKLNAIRKNEAEHLNQLRMLNEHLETLVANEVAAKMEVIKQREAELEALIQNEKMAQLGEMMGILLHQWSQPLSTISIYAQALHLETLLDTLNVASVDEASKSIVEQVNFMTETANDFRSFYKPSKYKQNFSIHKQLQSVSSIMKKQLSIAGVNMEITGDENICSYGYASEFKQVMLNIINNAKDALLEQKIVAPTIKANISMENSTVVITISDNAGGIPESLLPDMLFEQFVSTKGSEGTGVGLSLSKTIIQDRMGGKLSVSNNQDGAVFRIELPVA